MRSSGRSRAIRRGCARGSGSRWPRRRGPRSCCWTRCTRRSTTSTVSSWSGTRCPCSTAAASSSRPATTIRCSRGCARARCCSKAAGSWPTGRSPTSSAPTSPEPVIAVVQLDALSLTLLERLLEEERLPRLAELTRRGRWHRLRTPAEHFAGASFHTLYTGVEVGNHGLYYAFQWDAPAQRVRWGEHFPGPATAWERLDAAGARCLILDLYEARPPATFSGLLANGVQF